MKRYRVVVERRFVQVEQAEVFIQADSIQGLRAKARAQMWEEGDEPDWTDHLKDCYQQGPMKVAHAVEDPNGKTRNFRYEDWPWPE